MPIAVGDDVALTETASDYHWYAADLEAGKNYVVNWTNGVGILFVLPNCPDNLSGDNHYGGINNGDASFTVVSTQTYYIDAVGSDGALFAITELPDGDSRICANAQTIALNDVVTLTTTDNTPYWYAITLDADKVYVIDWEAGSDGNFELYRTCGGSQIIDGNDFTYSPSAAGTYYVKAQGWSGGKFTVKKTTLGAADNRICANAQAVTGTDITPATADGVHYWYKVELEADKMYELSRESDSDMATLYASCGSSEELAFFDNWTYTPTDAGTYYIEAYSYSVGNKFKIAEVTDNRVCAHAENLAPNTESPALPQYEHRWYKVELAAGKVYAIDWQNNGEGSVEVYSTCGGSRFYSNGGVYEITTASTYYISAYSYNAGGKFKVSEITGNRICANATPLAVGAESPTLPQRYTDYWYKVNLAAGKAYAIEWQNSGSGSFGVYDACGGNLISGNGSAYEITTAGTYYISAYTHGADSKFKVSEVTDNRSCAHATPLAVGAESPALPKTRIDYWYKVNLAAGKTYAIEWQNSGNGSFEVYDACGGNSIFSIGSTYGITTAGTYYISATASSADGKFKVSEVTGNRICANATPLTLDAESPALPQQYTYYWYEVELAAGKSYAIEWQNSGNGYFTVYDACGGSRVNSTGSAYAITTAGTYYISAYSYDADSKFKVSEVTDNRTCANATAMGAESPTLPQRNNYYWYKVELTAGKSYVMEKTNGEGMGALYDACGGSTVAYIGDDSPYTVTESGTFYLRLFGYDDAYKVKVSEVTTPEVTTPEVTTPEVTTPEVTTPEVTPPEVTTPEVTPPTVQSVQILAVDGMSVQKGGTQKFVAQVTATGGAAQTVTWSVNSTVSSIAADGTLSIGAAETATTLVVTATSTADNSKQASVTVTVTTDELVAAVLGVVVTPNTASVAKGSTQQFKAVVLVQGGAAQTVTWSVSGGIAGTSISDGGLLTVAVAETASKLTVTVTSTVDASKKSTALVTVTAAGSTTGTETVTADDTPLRPYPNPVTNGQLTIDNDQLKASDRIAIYNMNGDLMGVYKVSSGVSTTLNIGHLPTGIYIVKAGKRTAKVVKQ
ncbi:hypothetical protein AGMMS4957_18870 [Bacteroidia bacterium]|nr:hypothetical protein AGMMS4957_18870 [Bacteroidia bacterium]